MNLLEETIKRLQDNSVTEADVLWVGNNEVFTTWDNFVNIANVDYDNGYGRQEIATDLVIVGKDWWLERHEYDGSEWWEFKQSPIKPNVNVLLTNVIGDGWNSLTEDESYTIVKPKPSVKLKTFVKALTHLSNPLAMTMGMETGWGNGYVILPKEHKFNGIDYDEIPVMVHWGLTFGSYAKELRDWNELPEDCNDTDWVVGFDCAHSGDNMITCPKSFVEEETESLRKLLEEL